jgi:hypothetical protein
MYGVLQLYTKGPHQNKTKRTMGTGDREKILVMPSAALGQVDIDSKTSPATELPVGVIVSGSPMAVKEIVPIDVVPAMTL